MLSANCNCAELGTGNGASLTIRDASSAVRSLWKIQNADY